MSEYTLSAYMYKLKKQYNMADISYLIYADLRAAGWGKGDAWSVAFQGQGLNWAKAELIREIEKLEALDSVQTRIADVQGSSTPKNDEITAEELAKDTSKEAILRKLVAAEKKAKKGSPEWIKIVALEADYNKIKQDEIDVENNTVHFHLPVNYPTSCKNCLLYKNKKEKI